MMVTVQYFASIREAIGVSSNAFHSRAPAEAVCALHLKRNGNQLISTMTCPAASNSRDSAKVLFNTIRSCRSVTLPQAAAE